MIDLSVSNRDGMIPESSEARKARRFDSPAALAILLLAAAFSQGWVRLKNVASELVVDANLAQIERRIDIVPIGNRRDRHMRGAA
jgi:hypothetical protein